MKPVTAAVVLILGLVSMATSLPYYQQPYYYGYHGYNHPGYLGYTGHNHEFDYRQFSGHPVHVGNGEFFFLGIYGGSCEAGHDYGFYFAATDSDSFIVCDHGRSHHFQCPAGTKNQDYGYFTHNHGYGLNQLCGQHTQA